MFLSARVPGRQIIWTHNKMSTMGITKEATLVDGKFKYKKHPDGSTNKSVVICTLCRKEFAYHRSTSTLRYHLNAKHVGANAQLIGKRWRRAKPEGGPPLPPPFTQAEELAPSQNRGWPITDGIPGGSSTQPTATQDMNVYVKVIDGVVIKVEPPAVDEETVSAASEWADAFGRPIDNMTNVQPNTGPSASRGQLGTSPFKDLYKLHLQKKIEKTDLKMEQIKQQMRLTQLEIELLEHKLKEIKKS
ncbi:uncharacterized protein LOC143519541 [Brachyhypopomus gauderio]|uniref:uncharacterized protein LOC143519541 n=1 Tax=Brachyhypopomus gauderio TaxID=698409 RepID=UPI0040420DA9